jgi:zinc protease
MRRAILATMLLAAACKSSSAPDGDGPPPPYVEPPDEGFRSTHPPAGAPRPFQSPAIDRFTMDDGVEVVLVERHIVPVVYWQLQLPGGSALDPPGKEGRAELCSWVLVQQRDDSAGLLADMGSSVSESSSADTLSLNGFSLRPNVDATLDLWAEDAQMPGMDAADLDRLRGRLVAALPQAVANPSAVAARVLATVTYGAGHPFARWATAASYAALTVDDCRQYIDAVVRPRGARLLVAGDISRAEVEQKFPPRLATMSSASATPVTIPAAMPQPARLVFSDAPGSTQTTIIMTGPGPAFGSDDDYPATVMAAIFAGDSLTSRLGMDLREMMGSTYSVSGAISHSRLGGRLVINAPVQTDKTQAALATMLADARIMRETEVSDDELARARDGRIASLPARFETVSATLGQFSSLAYFDLPFTYYQDYAARFGSVDKAAVQHAAASSLAPDELRFVVVGDRTRVLPMLQALTTPGAPLQGVTIQVVDASGTPVP